MGKASDLEIELKACNKAWESHQHEPLLLFLYLPLSREHPWRWKGRKELDEVGRAVSAMWETDQEFDGSILRELLFQAWSLQTMPKRVVP